MKLSSVPLIFTLTFGLLPVHSSAQAAEAAEVDAATRARVLAAIEDYVREDQALKSRFFVLDPRSGDPLALSFDHVHSGVHPHEKGFRACVDFTDETGSLYDVDVVVAVGDDGEDAVRAVWLHKAAGEAIEAPSE